MKVLRLQQKGFQRIGDVAGAAGNIVAVDLWRCKVEERNRPQLSQQQIVFNEAAGKERIPQPFGYILGQLGAVVDFHREAVIPGKQVLNIQADSLQGEIAE